MDNFNVINDISMHFANPVLMLITGDYSTEHIALLRESFGDMNNEYITMAFGNNDAVVNDDIIILPQKTELKNDSEFIALLDKEIRRMKSQKFINNDLTICLFLDSESINIPYFFDICIELYGLLHKSCYNNIYFDIYFLLLEDFFVCNKTITKNISAMNILSNYANQDCIRRIFLLSEVNSKEQLVTDRRELFHLMLNSVLLTNCLVNDENINRLQNVFIRESESSKYFCIGQISLFPSEQEIQQMMKVELVNHIFNNNLFNVDSPHIPSFFKVLYDDIKNEILNMDFEITPECSYIVPISLFTLTNSDYLYLFFKDEPIKKKAEIVTECKKIFSKKEDFYWQQVNAWINDLQHQFNINFWDPQFEGVIIATVISVINKCQSRIYMDCKMAHEKYFFWKNQQITLKRKIKKVKEQDLAVRLLKQWWELHEQEMVYIVFDSFIMKILNRIKLWQDDIIRKTKMICKIQNKTNYMWKILMQNSASTPKLLLKINREFFSDYLIHNSWKIDACRGKLNNILKNEISFEDLENTLSQLVEQFWWEIRQYQMSFQRYYENSCLNNSQIEQLYMDICHTFETDYLLNARRNICNTELYLCLYGVYGSPFIRYIKSQKDLDYIFCFEGQCMLDKVIYYQNISSIYNFFWKENSSELYVEHIK